MIEFSRSEITPEHVFMNRRKFMVGAGSAVTLAALAACSTPDAPAPVSSAPVVPAVPLDELPGALSHVDAFASSTTDELGDSVNSYEEITNYNNFYEFSTDKQAVACLASNFMTRPWEVKVGGLVNNPMTLTIDDIIANFDQEERIYRLRCVEAWSMIIPWVGFPMSKLLQEVDPKPEALVREVHLLVDPEQLPGQKSSILDWPYVEGLRLDEAMNDLAIFGTGMYGKLLTRRMADLSRIVVPWKYGFKSIKSVVQIDLVRGD